ncbi:MAG: ABC transporter permease [Deltaproteobacteria bacterium]|jgi:putative ABC transport system permease protein|nr:ABC transporter permease [Deltaproteobacteria bacterium]MBW2534364.1 ABC transporter permease [Deltaproteobacteria bacterium]
MIARLIQLSLTRQKKAIVLMVASVAAGTAVMATFAALALDIQNKAARELRSFGANIAIEPRIEGLADLVGQARHLEQRDLPRARSIFWRHNVLGLAPVLESTVRSDVPEPNTELPVVGLWLDRPLPGVSDGFRAGIRTVSPWWRIPDSGFAGDGVLLGASLAARLQLEAGDPLRLDGRRFEVAGVLHSGGVEDEAVVMELGALQELKGLQGKLSRVLVSALTTPMDDFAYRDPGAMSPAEYEKWYCTGYVSSIALQLEEVFEGSTARPIWRVAQAEGQVLGRLRALMLLFAGAVFLSSALGMSTTLTATFLERISEIALMKSLGADSHRILGLFGAEAALIGLLGGALGWVIALTVADRIGLAVFGAEVGRTELLLPLSLGSALAISALAALPPVYRALKVAPAVVLKEAL